jgi:serine/threonine protein kinase
MNVSFNIINEKYNYYLLIEPINKKYKINILLGYGSTGKVYKIENDEGKYVIKISNNDINNLLTDEINKIIDYSNQFNIIIKSFPLYYGKIINSNITCILYPYFGYYNLETIKSINYNIKYKDNIDIIKQIITQLIGFKNIIHCDLKSANIVLSIEEEIIATIVDCGLLKDNYSLRDIISTNYITSPESILTIDPFYKLNNTILCFAKHDYFGLFSIIINLFINNNIWEIYVEYLVKDLEIKEKYIRDVNFTLIYCYMWYRLNFNDKNKIEDKSLYQLISIIESNYPTIVCKKFILFDDFFTKYIIPNINYKSISKESIEYIKILLYDIIQFCPMNRPTLKEILIYLEKS